MTQYHKYLKDWTSERGITSFLGSDKPAFQQDWKEEKRAGVRFGEEMGREDINRAGEPFKKPVAKKRTAAEDVLDNPDLMNIIRNIFHHQNHNVSKLTAIIILLKAIK